MKSRKPLVDKFSLNAFMVWGSCYAAVADEAITDILKCFVGLLSCSFSCFAFCFRFSWYSAWIIASQTFKNGRRIYCFRYFFLLFHHETFALTISKSFIDGAISFFAISFFRSGCCWDFFSRVFLVGLVVCWGFFSGALLFCFPQKYIKCLVFTV